MLFIGTLASIHVFSGSCRSATTAVSSWTRSGETRANAVGTGSRLNPFTSSRSAKQSASNTVVSNGHREHTMARTLWAQLGVQKQPAYVVWLHRPIVCDKRSLMHSANITVGITFDIHQRNKAGAPKQNAFELRIRTDDWENCSSMHGSPCSAQHQNNKNVLSVRASDAGLRLEPASTAAEANSTTNTATTDMVSLHASASSFGVEFDEASQDRKNLQSKNPV
jgi:hypothetical protein